MQSKDVRVYLNISPELKKRLRQLALDRNTTMTDIIKAAIDEYIYDRGEISLK